MSDKANYWHAAKVISSITFGLFFLLIVIDSVRVITAPEFQRMHNQAHYCIFHFAVAIAFLFLCVTFAFAARKQSYAIKDKS